MPIPLPTPAPAPPLTSATRVETPARAPPLITPAPVPEPLQADTPAAPWGVMLLVLPVELQHQKPSADHTAGPLLPSLVDQVIAPFAARIRDRLILASKLRSVRLNRHSSSSADSRTANGASTLPEPRLDIGAVFYHGLQDDANTTHSTHPSVSEDNLFDSVNSASSLGPPSTQLIPLQPVSQMLKLLRQKSSLSPPSPSLDSQAVWERKDALDAIHAQLHPDPIAASTASLFYAGVSPDAFASPGGIDGNTCWHEKWACGDDLSTTRPSASQNGNGILLAEALVAALELLPAPKRKQPPSTWLNSWTDAAPMSPVSTPSPTSDPSEPFKKSRKRKRDSIASPTYPPSPTCVYLLTFLPASSGIAQPTSPFSSFPASRNCRSENDFLSWTQAAESLAACGVHPCTFVLKAGTAEPVQDELDSITELDPVSAAAKLHRLLCGSPDDINVNALTDPLELKPFSDMSAGGAIGKAAVTGLTMRTQAMGTSWGRALPALPAGYTLWSKPEETSGTQKGKSEALPHPGRATQQRDLALLAMERKHFKKTTMDLLALQYRDAYLRSLHFLDREHENNGSKPDTNQASSTPAPAATSQLSKPTAHSASVPLDSAGASTLVRDTGGPPQASPTASTTATASAPASESASAPTSSANQPVPASRSNLPEPKLVISTLYRTMTSGVAGVTQNVVQGFQFILLHLVTMQRSVTSLQQTRQLLQQNKSPPPSKQVADIQNVNFSALDTAQTMLLALQHKVYGMAGALAAGRVAAAAQANAQGPSAATRTGQAVSAIMQELVSIDTAARNAGLNLSPSFRNPHFKSRANSVASRGASGANGSDSCDHVAVDKANFAPAQTEQALDAQAAPPVPQSTPIKRSQSPDQQKSASASSSAPGAASTSATNTMDVPSEVVHARELMYTGTVSWSVSDPQAKNGLKRKDVATHITATALRDTTRNDL